jgi:hypothetical protein
MGLSLADVSEEYGGGGGRFAHEAVALEELAAGGIHISSNIRSAAAHDIVALGYDVRIHRSADAANGGRKTDAHASAPGALPHRLDWFETLADRHKWWLEVRNLQDRLVAGFSVTVIPVRTLPGHRFLRLERLRFAPEPGAAEAAVIYLADFARQDWRTLGVTVEIFFADETERRLANAALAHAGFRPARDVRMYTHTLRIDLTPEPEKMLAGFHSTARRHIRAIAKRPVEIRLVEDALLAPRLSAILNETFDRTAGSATREPWGALIEYSRAHPDLARLVSLVRTDRAGSEALVSFALGLNRGDHVEYSTAGSTRPPDLKMPFGYALAWDLMEWARSVGARWFDFGGIAPDQATDGTRRGIHEFKRAFGGNVVEVRQTWSLEVRPVRAAWARRVSRVAADLRRLATTKTRPRSLANATPG